MPTFKSPFSNNLTSGVSYAKNPQDAGLGNTVKKIKSQEELSIERKLINPSPSHRTPQQKSQDGTPYPNSQLSTTIINDTAQNIIDGRNLTRLLPDIKTARLLLVSAILSPKDLVSTQLTYCNEAEDFGNIKAPLLQIIEDSIESVHKMDEVLPDWLDEILFEKGAKILMVLPESQLDDIINSDLSDGRNKLRVESFVNKITPKGSLPHQGLLGSKPDSYTEKSTSTNVVERMRKVTLAHESASGVIDDTVAEFKGERTITFTDKVDSKNNLSIDYILQDNVDLIKLGKLNEKLTMEEARLRFAKNFKIMTTTDWSDLYDITPEEKPELATEAQVGVSAKAMDTVLAIGDNAAHGVVRDRAYNWKPVQAVKDNFNLNSGEPLEIEVPAECVVPVYLFGRPDEHIGYFFAVEPTGTFVTVTDDTDYYRDMVNSRNRGNNGNAGAMIDQVNQSTYGAKDSTGMNIREEQQLLSAATLNSQFLESLKYGAYNGIKLAVGNTDGISRLMLARALSGDMTHFLYVPKDIVTYIAFDYNDYGVGVSLLAQNKMQGAIRAMMQFVNTQAAINNAVVHSRLDITLDEYEADSERTLETIYHEAVRRRVGAFPLGVSSPMNQLEYMARSSLSLNVEQHPDYPNTKVAMEYFDKPATMIDNEFTESLKKDFLSGLGINAESIDMSMGVELAQTIVSSNIMLAKRAMIYQNKFCVGLTNYVKVRSLQSPSTMNNLIECILENKDEFKGRAYYSKLTDSNKQHDTARKLALKFLSELYVSLPKPDLNTLEMQTEAIKEKEEFYDMLVDYVISEDLVADWEVGETVQSNVDHFRNMFKNYLMRQWIQENNFAPEVFTILGLDSDSEKIVPMLESNKEFKARLGKFLGGYYKESVKQAEKSETIATNAGQNSDDLGGGLSTDTNTQSTETDTSLDMDTSNLFSEDANSAFGDNNLDTSTVPGED